MKSLAVFPGKKETKLIDLPVPGKPGHHEAKLKILEVGICGTDREISHFEYGAPPHGTDHLVLGHEALAQVIEIGDHVQGLKVGDLVVPTVRRPCRHERCLACRSGRQDFCLTGDFTERGIKQAQGFLSEYALEDESYLVRVPEKLRNVAVLVEPLSIATKAGQQAFAIQERIPLPQRHPRGLILGAGPVGILGGMVLQSHGFDVYIYSAEASASSKGDLVRSFGATYVSAKDLPLTKFKQQYGSMDMIYEAVGITKVAFESFSTLGPNGICILTGIPGISDTTSVEMGTIMRDLVLNNQLVFGTVNAGTAAFESAIQHLEQFMFLFPESVLSLMSHYPMSEGPELLKGKKGIKDIIRVAS